MLLVTGAAGLLGRSVADLAETAGERVLRAGHDTLDVGDDTLVNECVERHRPSAVIHCAAMTNVDLCESEPDLAHAVNAVGSANVARAAQRAGAKLVAVSTDYVFDGTKGSPYTEDDATNPIQVYGASKLAGERAVIEACERHFIVRSAWIYGDGGKNFISRLPTLVGGSVNAVEDQTGSPTSAFDLARAILRLVSTEKYGAYHVTNSGETSFAGLVRFALEGKGIEIKPISSRDRKLPAARPGYTALENRNWTRNSFPKLRSWQDAITEFMAP